MRRVDSDITNLDSKRDFIERLNISFKGEGSKDAASLIESWIKEVSAEEFEDAFSVMAKRPIDIDGLTGKIDIEFYSEGSNKSVYKVHFWEGIDQTFSVIIAFKKELKTGRIQQNEIEDLKWLSTKKRREIRLTPLFGSYIELENGKKMYLEEFIEGPSARDLKNQGKLTVDIKENIISTLTRIGILLGNNFPKDLNHDNFVVDIYSGDSIMVDIGNKRFSLPVAIRSKEYDSMIEFLFLLFVHYAEPENNAFIINALFDGIDFVEVFLNKNNIKTVRKDKTISEAKKEMVEFLKESLAYISKMDDIDKDKFIKKNLLANSVYLRRYFQNSNINEEEQRIFLNNYFINIEETLEEVVNRRAVMLASRSKVIWAGDKPYTIYKAVRSLSEPQLRRSNVYARYLRKLLDSSSDESIKRYLTLLKIGPEVEKLIAEILQVDKVKIAIFPLGSTLKGYSTDDSDIEYAVFILDGISHRVDIDSEEDRDIRERVGVLIKREGIEPEEMPAFPIENIVKAVNGYLEPFDLDEGLGAFIEEFRYVFLPMAYGNPQLIEMARKNIIDVLDQDLSPDYIWFDLRREFLELISIDYEHIKQKQKIVEFLRKQGVDIDSDESIREYLKRHRSELNLPNFEEMRRIYLEKMDDGPSREIIPAARRHGTDL